MGVKILTLVLASDTPIVYTQFQSIWRMYMKSHPDIDCYFYKADPALESEYRLDDDTLWIRGEESLDNVYEKTLKAFEYFAKNFQNYDFVFRPNISSFVVFPKYVDFCQTLSKTRLVSAFVGGEGDNTFPSGSGFTMSTDVVLELLKDKPPVVFVDDVTIGTWLHTKGIPIHPAPRCDFVHNSYVPYFLNGNKETTFHYRVKNADRSLDIEIHKNLFRTFYN